MPASRAAVAISAAQCGAQLGVVLKMGYVPPTPPPRLNLDRFGMPRDYATYVWLLYRRYAADDSPARRASASTFAIASAHD